MSNIIPEHSDQSNYETFRECLSEPVLKALAVPDETPKKRKKRQGRKARTKKTEDEQVESNAVNSDEANDAEDLGEFIEYLSSVIFPSLPVALRSLSYPKFKDSISLQDRYSTPLSKSTINSLLSIIPPDGIDSLSSYGLLPSSPDANDLHHFFTPVFSAYITGATSPPPIWSTTRTTECELCHRDWINLTYHHLIPKSTHDRVMKRGWHTEDQLNSVAWLCRACHSFVHRIATNEELAKSWYTVDLLDERDDVQAWVKWVGKVRWKKQ